MKDLGLAGGSLANDMPPTKVLDGDPGSAILQQEAELAICGRPLGWLTLASVFSLLQGGCCIPRYR